MAHSPKLAALRGAPGAASHAVSAISAANGTNTVGRARSARYPATRSIDDMHYPAIVVHIDRRSARNSIHGVLHADYTRNAELARDDRAVRQHPAALDHESRDQEENRTPTGICLARHEPVSYTHLTLPTSDLV